MSPNALTGKGLANIWKTQHFLSLIDRYAFFIKTNASADCLLLCLFCLPNLICMPISLLYSLTSYYRSLFVIEKMEEASNVLSRHSLSSKAVYLIPTRLLMAPCFIFILYRISPCFLDGLRVRSLTFLPILRMISIALRYSVKLSLMSAKAVASLVSIGSMLCIAFLLEILGPDATREHTDLSVQHKQRT